MIHTDRHAAIALGAIAVLALLSCFGCGATITVNVMSSHSRYGQAVGGTDTTIRGQIEGGGALTATVPMSP
jgi:ABC-type phosphate transport system substrate-binding protein